jgi:uncharacterized protein with PQ loop repeat
MNQDPGQSCGIAKGEMPIMLADTVTLMLASMVLFFKLRRG